MTEPAHPPPPSAPLKGLDAVWRPVRKILIAIAGVVVLMIGVAMIVLPGPAVVFIPLGLSILAAEFVWAAVLLRRLRRRARQTMLDAARLRQQWNAPGGIHRFKRDLRDNLSD